MKRRGRSGSSGMSMSCPNIRSGSFSDIMSGMDGEDPFGGGIAFELENVALDADEETEVDPMSMDLSKKQNMFEDCAPSGLTPFRASLSAAGGRNTKKHASAGQWLTPPLNLYPKKAADGPVTTTTTTTTTIKTANPKAAEAPFNPFGTSGGSVGGNTATRAAFTPSSSIHRARLKKQQTTLSRSNSTPGRLTNVGVYTKREVPKRPLGKFSLAEPSDGVGSMDVDSSFTKEGASVPKRSRSNNDFSSSFAPSSSKKMETFLKSPGMRMVVSCPNLMAVMCQRFEKEGERREKRLERNRASARLRRLRKKSVVDQLVIEVGDLERQIMLARRVCVESRYRSDGDSGEHSLGIEHFMNDLRPLINCFTPNKEQYAPTQLRRLQNMEFIYDMSISQAALLQQDLNWMIHLLENVVRDDSERATTSAMELVARAKTKKSREQARETLGLSKDDVKHIEASFATVVELEALRLMAIRKCFRVARGKQWHVQKTVDEWNGMLVGVLTCEQVQRLLEWTKKNEKTIQRAEVHALP